jgi:hypothetical protein
MRGFGKILPAIIVMALFSGGIARAEEAKPAETAQKAEAAPAPEAAGPSEEKKGEPAPAAEIRPVETPKKEEAKKPAGLGAADEAKRLVIGGTGGWWQPGATLQLWYVYDNYERRVKGDVKESAYNKNTFRVRRAELSVKGEIWPKLFGFGVMIDPARILDGSATTLTITDKNKQTVGTSQSVNLPASAALSPLQDIWLSYLNDYAEVSIGQFKIPVSWEGVYSSAKLIFPERALVSRQFGDKRDIGLRVTKKFKYFMYNAGVFNGSGQNQIDNNSSKDLTLRLEAYPLAMLKIDGAGLMIGGAIYSTVGDFDDNTNPWKVRYEADIRFEGYGAIVQAEYIRSQDRKAGAGNPLYFGDGYYVMLGYTVLKQLTFAFRFGQLNGDATHVLKPTDSAYFPFTTHLEGAVCWKIKKDDLKLHASYSYFNSDNVKPTNHEFILTMQVAY